MVFWGGGSVTAFLIVFSMWIPIIASRAEAHSAYVKAVYSLPATLDPILMTDTSSLLVSNLMYDGLLRFTPDLQFEGALAASWTTENNGKRYVFTLRPEIRFHDGSAITSADVVASLQRTLEPKSSVAKYYDCIAGSEEFRAGRARFVSGLSVRSKNVVVVDLKYPFPPFLSVLAGATAKVLPLSASRNPKFFDMPIGSGPFKLVDVREGDKSKREFVFERFEQYAAGRAKLDTLKLIELSEKEALSQARQGKVHDLASYPLSGQEAVFQHGHEINTPIAATWIIGLNMRLSPFSDLSVRQAFKDAVDAEEFRRLFHPDAIRASGYIPKGLPGYSERKPRSEPKARLPKHKHIRIAFPEVLSRQEEMRTFLERDLRGKGWQVSFVPMSWGKLMKGYNDKSLQAFVVSMNMDYPDTEFLIRNFESNNPDNFSGLADKEIDQLIRTARSTPDRMQRSQIYSSILKRVEYLSPTVNLFHPRAHAWVNRCVKGFAPSILADYYIDYRNVELGSECSVSGSGL